MFDAKEQSATTFWRKFFHSDLVSLQLLNDICKLKRIPFSGFRPGQVNNKNLIIKGLFEDQKKLTSVKKEFERFSGLHIPDEETNNFLLDYTDDELLFLLEKDIERFKCIFICLLAKHFDQKKETLNLLLDAFEENTLQLKATKNQDEEISCEATNTLQNAPKQLIDLDNEEVTQLKKDHEKLKTEVEILKGSLKNLKNINKLLEQTTTKYDKFKQRADLEHQQLSNTFLALKKEHAEMASALKKEIAKNKSLKDELNKKGIVIIGTEMQEYLEVINSAMLENKKITFYDLAKQDLDNQYLLNPQNTTLILTSTLSFRDHLKLGDLLNNSAVKHIQNVAQLKRNLK